MELLETIKKRRSIRKFKENKIDRKIVEDILNCGRLAPSAKNKQPWFFMVLDGTFKNEIADVMLKVKFNSKAEIGYISSVKETAKIIKKAQYLILILRKKDNRWLTGDNLSIGACVQNMCLRATDLGLGSLWVLDIIYASDKIQSILNNDEMELSCGLVLGYPDEKPNIRKRKKLNDITRWYSE